MAKTLPDQIARDQALDVEHSFIVQAPAGSGKTELLTLRYLKLLATCEQPEEVLAITFTKKAASEMRDRIIRALNWSQDCIDGICKPENGIEELRFAIAQTVLQKDAESGWRLLSNPARFRVQTIDSFCFYLAKQLPILSQVGGDPQLMENIDHCFHEAVNSVLAYLETDTDIADDVETLLTHLDNDIARAEDLLSNLLQQRDQWANHLFKLNVPGHTGAEDLTENIAEWVSEILSSIREQLQPEEAVLVELFNFAAAYRQQEDNLPIKNFTPLQSLPGDSLDDLPYWQVMLEFLLTQDMRTPKWLSQIQKKHGFPAKSVGDKEFKAQNEALKQQRNALIERLDLQPDLLQSLSYLRLLPSLEIAPKEWQFLAALFRILHLLSGELYLALRKFKVVDYTQIGACAMQALGDDEQPTDIALALDHVIRHILVDEFQDTSYFQRILLQKLTAGWEPDDGRSLFLVGDAMQSCYGFRNANVGIYLDVWENGLPTVALDTLTLTTNFRSQSNIVDWVNEVFQSAFPPSIDISRGAVPYSLADAIHPALDNVGVSVALLHHDKEERLLAAEAEAAAVAQQAIALSRSYPDDSIAILVRNRSHLSAIVPHLREAGLNWTASDIDRLNSLAVIDDLMSILRILLHPGDRLSWIALLRAPWCGLGIKDLHTLANHELAQPDLWNALQQHQTITELSAWGKQVLPDFISVMNFALSMRFRTNLRSAVEATWGLLRGLNCCNTELELESAQRFLSLVSEKETAGGLSDLQEFEEAVDAAFVPSPAGVEASGLHLLTMHKSKGLEFDHVLLPALNRGARSDEKPLLVWHERLNQYGDNRLFMAGLTATGEDDGPLYQLLRHEQKLKDQLESTRLLYIAVTRAKKSATLYASVARDDSGEITGPSTNSLLARIWPVVSDSDKISLLPLEETPTYREFDEPDVHNEDEPTLFRRFDTPWQLTETEKQLLQTQLTQLDSEEESEELDNEQVFEQETLVGILVHRCLEHYVQAEDQQLYLDTLSNLHTYWKLKLRHLNLDESELESLVKSMDAMVRDTVTHQDLAWVFDSTLEDSACELALSRIGEEFLSNKIIDRTFIDRAGTRWVIDYKTGEPGINENEAAFIARQSELHDKQLTTYKRLFEEMDAAPVKTALLFTSLPKLVELNLD